MSGSASCAYVISPRYPGTAGGTPTLPSEPGHHLTPDIT